MFADGVIGIHNIEVLWPEMNILQMEFEPMSRSTYLLGYYIQRPLFAYCKDERIGDEY